MREMGCGFGPFGRHFQGMGPFGHPGQNDRFGCGPHFGPYGQHFGLPGHHFGPLGRHFGHPGHGGHGRGGHGRGGHGPTFRGFGWGPEFRPEIENCCQDNCESGGQEPRPREDGSPGCSNRDYHQGRRDPEECGCSPDKHPCGRRCKCRREKSSRPHGPCYQGRHHGALDQPCDRRAHDDESGPEGPRGQYCPMRRYGRYRPYSFFGGPFGGPYCRPFGPCNRHGPCDRCQRNNSDEESGNETERRGRKNGPCCKNNKDQNRDDTVLIQRIIVEKVPRCKSI